MAEGNVSKATVTNMSNVVDDYSVPAAQTEGVSDQKETTYISTKWANWYGYYKTIPELKAAIDALATWTTGKGYKANGRTTVLLDNVNGVGVDTFDGILKNMIIVANINGDAFAEIVRNEKGILINLKPLDPASVRVVFNRKGRIIRYEQLSKTGKEGVVEAKFEPNEIFHLTKDRIADNIHGTSLIESVEWVILARNEAMDDQRRLMHRNVVPRVIWHLDEDNEDKIKAFKDKQDLLVKTSENIVVPKGTVEHDVLSVPPNATLNPMPWIEYLTSIFWKVIRIPQIIVGGSQEFTEATAKIAYLAFQQNVEEFQREIEEQVWDQLALRIELEFPASLENELLSDQKKDKETGIMKPSDTKVGVGQE